MSATLRPEHARRFRRLVANLNRLRAEVEADGFDANWYLNTNTLSLMDGDSRDEDDAPRRDRELCHAVLDQSSGGDW